jgi:protein-tyrosine kinase
MSKMYEALRKAQLQGVAVDLPTPLLPAMPAGQESPLQTEEPPIVARGRDYSPSNPEDGNLREMRQLPIQLNRRAAVIPWDTSRPGGEQYRIIRTRIVQHPLRPKVIMVSSPGSGDGKTISAVNIAGMLSLRDNANVLLIDADFRRAGVSSALGLPPGPGLSDTLQQSCPLQQAIIRVEQFPNLYVLPAGTSETKTAELLDSDPWKSLCSTVREQFSFVMIDAPPIAAVADYELIQASCDGVIIVVRPDHTDRTLVSKAFELIPEDKRLGVVLNCAYEWFLWKTHESYYYASRGE